MVSSQVFDEYSLWNETIHVDEGGKSTSSSSGPLRMKAKLEKKELAVERTTVIGIEPSLDGGFPQKIHLKLPDYSKCGNAEAAPATQTLTRIHAAPVLDLNEECSNEAGDHKRFGRVAGGFSVIPPLPVSTLSIPHPCGSSQAVLAGIQHGKWIRRYEWFHGGPFYQAKKRDQTDDSLQEEWYTGCPMLNYSPEQVCDILSRFSRVIYIGDSLSRHMFSSTLMLITGNQQYGHMKRDAFATYDKWRLSCVGANALEESECRLLATHSVADMAFPSCPHLDDSTATADMNKYADLPSQRLTLRQWPTLGYVHEEGWESAKNTWFHYTNPEKLIREKVKEALEKVNATQAAMHTSKKNANLIPFRTEPLGALMLVNTGLHMVPQELKGAEEYYNELFRVFEMVPDIPLIPLWLPMHRIQDPRMKDRVFAEFYEPQSKDNCNFRVNRKIARLLRTYNTNRRKQLAANNSTLKEEDLAPFIQVKNKKQTVATPQPATANSNAAELLSSSSSSSSPPSSPSSASSSSSVSSSSSPSSSPSVLMCPNLVNRHSSPWMREWSALNFRSMTACTPPQWSWDGLHYIPALNIAKVTSLLNYMHALIQEHDRNFEAMAKKEYDKQLKQRKL